MTFLAAYCLSRDEGSFCWRVKRGRIKNYTRERACGGGCLGADDARERREGGKKGTGGDEEKEIRSYSPGRHLCRHVRVRETCGPMAREKVVVVVAVDTDWVWWG